MNKYELEKVLSKLDICRELLFQHIPEIYAHDASVKILEAIARVKKDIKELE